MAEKQPNEQPLETGNLLKVPESKVGICKGCNKGPVKSPANCPICKAVYHASCANLCKTVANGGYHRCCGSRPSSPLEPSPPSPLDKVDSRPITLADLHAALASHFAVFTEQQNALKAMVSDLATEQRQLRQIVTSFQESSDMKVQELADEQKMLRSAVDNSVMAVTARIDEMEGRLEAVGNSLAETQSDIEDLRNRGLSEDEIVAEVEERTRRAHNILVFDIPEPADTDPARVAGILAPLALPSDAYTVSRLGKAPPLAAGRKPRPIMVTFNSRGNARHVLRNKASLTLEGKAVAVRGDDMNRQRDLLKQARTALEERRKAGDADWTIRFVNGVPRVVRKDGGKTGESGATASEDGKNIKKKKTTYPRSGGDNGQRQVNKHGSPKTFKR